MGETSVLLVPIHMDALVVGERRGCVAPMADFTRLPHLVDGQEVHASAPWLGEVVASRPFVDGASHLERGTHLHWALPAALSRGARGEGGDLEFPAVPDRWLVTRTRRRGDDVDVDRWVVESDYLHPAGVQLASGVAYPFPVDLRRDRYVPPVGPPYRYLGRTRPLGEYLADRSEPAERLPGPLTAVGYGEPSFAAFYPNSRGVFGFHDPDGVTAEGVSYEVLGWYGDPERDHLRRVLERIGPPDETRLQRTLTALGFTAPGVPNAPVRLVCHARVALGGELPPPLTAPMVGFGNSITEALSACLATTGSGGDEALKAEIEDQLAAVLLSARLAGHDVDLGPKFAEARHAAGFAAAPASFLWAIRPASDLSPQAAATVPAWPDAARLLGELNALQRAYDDAWDEIRARRRQLVADWHRCMVCAHPPEGSAADYPDADTLRRTIEREGLPPLARLLAAAGELVGAEDPDAPELRASDASAPDSIAGRLVAAAASLHKCLRDHAVKLLPLHPAGTPPPMLAIEPRFVLQRLVAPRYFQPREPVLLLTGPAVQVHRGNFRDDDELTCAWLELPGEVPDQRDDITAHLETAGLWATRTVSGRPWHPFLLEWEVEMRPFEHLANHSAADGRYDPDFVTRNFVLRSGDVDFEPRADRPRLARHGHIYSGTSLLTPHGVDPTIDALTRELARERDGVGDPEHRPLPKATLDRLDAALTELGSLSTLAQSLSGFNDALLMNRQMLQLPIDDPLGFPAERAFAAAVHALVGDRVHRSPQPAHGFSPIRAGELRLRRLRLVDVFGQALDIDCARLDCHTPSTLPRRGGAAVLLPPRLVQPARLGFRWLAAGGPRGETNAHPDTSPVCGWLIADHLDQSLLAYTADGEALGALELDGSRVVWRSAPGRPTPIVQIDRDVAEPALRRLLRYLLGAPATYFADFLRDLEAAQLRSEPAGADDDLLVGRPLALVRASLQLQLQGPPALHQGWHELLIAMRSYNRSSDGFPAVRFPIRLGELDQLGDGLAVYFEEDAHGGYDGHVIPNYASAADADADPRHRNCDFLYQSAAAAALHVTMLVDPRGSVHAATGILPTKSIRIPPHHYQPALRRLELGFLAAPVLVDRTADTAPVALPVADEPGTTWQFVEPGLPARAVDPGPLHTPFTAPVEIREGWLHLTRAPNSGDDPR